MTEREEKIVDAAIGVIMRYGMKRATMNDIASEAGISRQTLYTVYSSKEEILKAGIRLMTDRALAAIELGSKDGKPLGEMFDLVVEQIALEPYRMLSTTPDAGDIIIGFNAAARDEMAVAFERHRVVLERLLEPYGPQIAGRGLSVRDLSDFLRNAITGFKHEAESEDHLAALLRSLKILLLTLVGEG